MYVFCLLIENMDQKKNNNNPFLKNCNPLCVSVVFYESDLC